MTHWLYVGLMLVHRLRRWPNITATLVRGLVSEKGAPPLWKKVFIISFLIKWQMCQKLLLPLVLLECLFLLSDYHSIWIWNCNFNLQMTTNEWLRGRMIQVQNSIFFCLCHFGKAKYIENNILKYLSHSSKNQDKIINIYFFTFKIDTFRQW